jgi:thiamine-phosphate pyrophosphorylase
MAKDFSPVHQKLAQAQLYLITSPVPNWLWAVEQALAGGVTLVQYRQKTASDQERFQDLLLLKDLCQQYQALLVVNDRLDLALAIDADGVHLGQTDLPVEVARSLLGSKKIIGQSTTNPQELAAALATSADYVGVGPVYETPTKPGKAAAGLDYVRYAAQSCLIPWFAIGGIDRHNLAEVQAAGATRVSVVRSLMTDPDPCQTARHMIQQLQSSQTPAPVSIRVNGESKLLVGSMSVFEVLTHLGLDPRLLALEYNGEILPRQNWKTQQVQNEDRLEIVTMVGGG